VTIAPMLSGISRALTEVMEAERSPGFSLRGEPMAFVICFIPRPAARRIARRESGCLPPDGRPELTHISTEIPSAVLLDAQMAWSRFPHRGR
jgi:hypothetical protein